MNETPTFMREALRAMKSTWKRTMFFSVINAAESCSGRYGRDRLESDLLAVLNRPKTPTLDEFKHATCIGRWLCRYFNPVFMAIADGKSDDEVIKIWINTDRFDRGEKNIGIGYSESSGRRKDINRRRSTKTVYARTLGKRHDWQTVK